MTSPHTAHQTPCRVVEQDLLEWLPSSDATDKNNQLLNTGDQAQQLSAEDIAELKSSGKSGDDIVAALLANSKTYESKTQYSQAGAQPPGIAQGHLVGPVHQLLSHSLNIFTRKHAWKVQLCCNPPARTGGASQAAVACVGRACIPAWILARRTPACICCSPTEGFCTVPSDLCDTLHSWTDRTHREHSPVDLQAAMLASVHYA